eukprot:scaffold254335_cov18-Tisochrysis_lutea.AAC.1
MSTVPSLFPPALLALLATWCVLKPAESSQSPFPAHLLQSIVGCAFIWKPSTSRLARAKQLSLPNRPSKACWHSSPPR